METGLRQQTLSRRLQDACSLSVMPSKRPTRDWSIDEKIRILAKAGKLTGAELTELLEQEGLLLAEYEQWRLALADEGRASLAATKQIRALERELARKEKALAEAAALLVLKKRVNGLWDGADDDSDEENERRSSRPCARRRQGARSATRRVRSSASLPARLSAREASLAGTTGDVDPGGGRAMRSPGPKKRTSWPS